MPLPPIIFPAKRRVHRKRKVQFGAPPAALTLVSVSWNTEEGVLSLEFDRAIDITGLSGESIRLKDGVTTNMVLGPFPPVFVQDGTTLVMSVMDIEPYAGSDVLLTVSADNGIVAVDNGVEFAGVSDLPVPFP